MIRTEGMERTMEYRGKWIDGHLHIKDEPGLELRELNEAMEDIRRVSAMEACAVQSIPAWDEDHVLQNPLALLQKALYPDTTYFFGGLDYYVREPEAFGLQVERLLKMGADGFKLIETKPMVAKRIGLRSIADAAYEPVFSLLEEKQVPVTWHVADPETFWDPALAPRWAMESGWFYGDGTFPLKEDLYRDVETVLERHPKLSVTFAHLYFLAYDLERLDAFMARHPSVRVDLTPGCEMYGGFALRPGDWRQFFIRYQDRILLGTDGGWLTGVAMEEKIGHAAGHAKRIRLFLSTEEELSFDEYRVRGLCLPEEVTRKILYENFIRVTGEGPKRLNRGEILDYFEMLEPRLKRGRDATRLREIKERLP